MPDMVQSGGLDVRFEQRGAGPDVLLIAGLGEPLESWGQQLDSLAGRNRLTAFDNRGVGLTALPAEPFSIATMAGDAAALMDTLGIGRAHVAGFSMGSAIAQELALAHPERVRSLVLAGTWAAPDPYQQALFRSWRWMAEAAPSMHDLAEAIALWVFTARAHADGTVTAAIEAELADPHPQPTENFQRTLDACLAHDTASRLGSIAVPALVLYGDGDRVCPPAINHRVAEGIPGASEAVLPGEGHLPLLEAADVFNARVADFWRGVEAAG